MDSQKLHKKQGRAGQGRGRTRRETAESTTELGAEERGKARWSTEQGRSRREHKAVAGFLPGQDRTGFLPTRTKDRALF